MYIYLFIYLIHFIYFTYWKTGRSWSIKPLCFYKHKRIYLYIGTWKVFSYFHQKYLCNCIPTLWSIQPRKLNLWKERKLWILNLGLSCPACQSWWTPSKWMEIIFKFLIYKSIPVNITPVPLSSTKYWTFFPGSSKGHRIQMQLFLTLVERRHPWFCMSSEV